MHTMTGDVTLKSTGEDLCDAILTHSVPSEVVLVTGEIAQLPLWMSANKLVNLTQMVRAAFQPEFPRHERVQCIKSMDNEYICPWKVLGSIYMYI